MAQAPMITTLDIKGFKSVKNLHLDCKRINLFIGEPNTGKSNILEALGFLSWCGHGGELHDYVRFEKTQDLFYDGLVEKGAWQLKVGGKSPFQLDAEYGQGEYRFLKSGGPLFLRLGHNGENRGGGFAKDELAFVKSYRFKPLQNMDSDELGSLAPPHGRNMAALVYSSKDLRRLAADYFAPYGLHFAVNPHEHKFEVQKQSEGIVVIFPYHLTSDTLRRMIFYTVAIDSNKDSTLTFEEPEAHAFPYYTKHLGERIALDENRNQYFIATHNPYLLTAIWEKSAAGEVAVFATYYRDYETRVKMLTEDDMTRLFEADPFLGVSHLVEEAP